MASSEDKYSRRRLQSSYISTVISMSLVLFMLGLLGMILLHAKRLSDHVKENIGFSVILKETVKEVDIIRLQKTLDARPYVKSTEFVDKDRAAKELEEELGENFTEFLGYNPLLSSIDVHLNADFANPDSIGWIEKELARDPKVKEVFYQKSLVSLVNENVKKISMVLLGFSALLLIIAIALINNSIRLAIYSKRFLIRSMQLVGATQGFIRRPFLTKGVFNGIYSACIAIALLTGLIYMAQRELPELFELQDAVLFASLFGIVIILGMLIAWICTLLAVGKYMRIKPEKLY